MFGMASGSHIGAPYPGNIGHYPQAFVGGGIYGGSSSPAGSAAIFEAAGGSSSRGGEPIYDFFLLFWRQAKLSAIEECIKNCTK
jgi:hypothetical protein